MRSLSDQLKFVRCLALTQRWEGSNNERRELYSAVIATLEKLKWLEEVSEEMKAREQTKSAACDDS